MEGEKWKVESGTPGRSPGAFSNPNPQSLNPSVHISFINGSRYLTVLAMLANSR
jgi:hypothetical protein